MPSFDDGLEGYPRKFGRYSLLCPLAQRGPGSRYLAVSGERRPERLSVIKTVVPERADAEYVARFRNEANVAVKLSHRNVLQVFDSGLVANELFLAMDFVEGCDLRAVWNRCAKKQVAIPIEIAVYLIQELCNGLAYAHAVPDLDLVHRDISPPNVLVSYTGEVKLTKFGSAASSLEREQAVPGFAYGKIAYMSPEQARAEKLDGRSDLYAAGIILWELLTGRQLFPPGKDQLQDLLAHARNPSPMRPSKRAPRVPETLDTICLQALAASKAERYADCDAMRLALQRWLAHHAPATDAAFTARFLEQLFAEDIARERGERADLLARFHAHAAALPPDQPPRAHHSGPSNPRAAWRWLLATLSVQAHLSPPAPPAPPAPAPPAPPPASPPARSGHRGSGGLDPDRDGPSVRPLDEATVGGATEREALPHALEAAVRKHLGAPGEIRALVRLTGGATKATWAFDAVVAEATLPLILQQAPTERLGFAPAAAVLQGAQEAALLQAALRAGVPAPRVRIVLEPGDQLGEGTVTERVAGETLGRKINTGARFAATRPRLAAQCGSILAAIHRIDATGLDFLVEQTARAQLAAYRAVADAYDHPLPVIEVGLRWVAENLPEAPRTCVVHGDFRTGNLIVGEDGIRCVLDWELAHRGDPMLDLGWLCVKTWRFGGPQPVGGFGTRDDLFLAYERAGGGSVDPAHVRFWEAFGCIKWALMCMAKGLGDPPGARRTVEAVAIGRRIEEPLLDFLELITTKEA
jgi:aminoglycoside phosphotransferase (APT) family kinase protein/serine/threonine protein kinase